MSLRVKLATTISMFILILTMLVIGVLSLSPANIPMGGSVNFAATDVYAKVSAEIKNAEGNPTLPDLYFSAKAEEASPQEDIEKWGNLDLVFDSSATAIEIEITIENLSSERGFNASVTNEIEAIENVNIIITNNGEEKTSVNVPAKAGEVTSSTKFVVKVEVEDQNYSVNNIYSILISLTDSNSPIQVEVYSNDESLGLVSGSGSYRIGNDITLKAEEIGGKFLAWATSTNPEDMEIISIDANFTFTLKQDSPTIYYALYNSTITENQTFDNFKYKLYNEAKLAEIIGTEINPSGELVLPSIITGENNESYKLFLIGNSAFEYFDQITSVMIPDSVTAIGEMAFYRCNALSTISIPKNVVTISSSAFYECKSLKNIEFAENSNIKFIKSDAFSSCPSLESLYFPESLEVIESAFSFCDNLSIVTFSKNGNLKTIEDGAFFGCTKITSIEFPSSLIKIGNTSFTNCSLESILVDQRNKVYHSEGNCLIETESKTLIFGCKNSIIPADGSVINIGDKAFYNCNGLNSIDIPSSIESIGNMAFYNCKSIKELNLSNNLKILGESAFGLCLGIEGELNIPDSVLSIGKGCFAYCSSITHVILSNNISEIEEGLFSGCTKLEQIELPASVVSINGNSFSYCDNLSEITINGNIAEIKDLAFSNCGSLTILNIGPNVTSIPENIFSVHLTNLTTINVLGDLNTTTFPSGKWLKDGILISSMNGSGVYVKQ